MDFLYKERVEEESVNNESIIIGGVRLTLS